ncbi:MAG: hypothetical protein V9E94_21085 [Microthrixaceae bacterium]
MKNINVRAGQTIAIGGLARSGKSELASVWRCALRERGIVAHVVSLDGWLKPFDKRGPEGGGWQDRYEAEALEEFLRLVMGRRDAGGSMELQIPQYDRVSRQARPDQLTRTIGKEDVVLFEGVVALEIPVLRSALRVWLMSTSACVRNGLFANTRGVADQRRRSGFLWTDRLT